LGEHVVLELVRGYRAEEPAVIVDRVFDVLRSHIGDTPLRDDLTLVVLRS
jgi:serine phosphatase RsbU (regulator of sigma subunit)